MENFIPKYVNKAFSYAKTDIVTAEEYNSTLNVIVDALDHNSIALNAILNDDATNLVRNAHHANEADHALLAEDSVLLHGSALSKSTSSSLIDSDSYVPSSKQVKGYVDAIHTSINATTGAMTTQINNILAKNTTQDNRLSNLDSITSTQGSQITGLTNRITTAETNITGVQNKNIVQDATLSNLDNRVKNLELGEVPEDVINSLMTKQSYALVTGLDGEGQPIYSTDTVNTSNVSNNVLRLSTIVSADALALQSDVLTLFNDSFINRGALTLVGVDYTVGQLKTLRLGAYSITVLQSEALNLPANTAGTLRIYPNDTALSLEFESHSGATQGHLYTVLIPNSIDDSTAMSTLSWYDEQNRIAVSETDITNLKNSRLQVTNLLSGTDVNIVKSGNDATFNYTGPKIVISTSQPAADPNRDTLWINL